MGRKRTEHNIGMRMHKGRERTAEEKRYMILRQAAGIGLMLFRAELLQNPRMYIRKAQPDNGELS